ncbi:MAG: S8 family serine peptidase, partial [FCB group bacterium]|nr:S8 family serine peptidase [FCB group bacterium]
AGLSAFHGSHTMGIMVGHDDATGDTVGVAPGADWIAAVAIDVPGSSIFQAFQWAADPDGNPNTVTDLPDVINHSWGLPQIECFDIFWDVIDNTEALGIVNIFSAGNNGPSSSTILSPASRAEDSLTNFAVGNYNQDDDVIVSSSARGPSPCDSYSIKPNVVAPGWYIRSTSYNSNYKNANGTSMAAPHVAGAVAILRQKNPEATVDEIKTALLNSAQDRGTFGKDNNFGWGLLDIVEALKQIDLLTRPSLQIEELAYSEIQPGDFLQLELVLKNSGASTDGVFAEFSHPESGMTLHTTSIDFGKIQSEDTSPGQSTLDLEFDLSLETGRFYSLDMNIFDEDGHLKYQRLSFFVGSPGQRSYFHHDAGRTKFTISNYGAFGFHGTSGNNASSGSYIPLDFLGFQFDTTVNDMFEGALLIGTDDEHVSDCARNFALEPDNDFAPVPGGSIVSFEPGSEADQETVSHFDDSFAEHPIGLNIEQHTYGWADMPDDKFIILEYIISNNSGGSIGGIRAGLFFDWDITSAGSNYGSFLPNDEIGFLFYFNSVDSSDFRGVKILNSEGMINHRIFIWDDILDGNLTEEKKYAALSNNFINANPPAITDLSHVTTTGPFNIGPGQSDTAVFAIIAGADWTEFMEAATLAEQKWDIVTDIDDTRPPLPTEFALAQNYPNPFNPATTLSFSLPRTGEAVLEIFNILGRRVKVLHDGRLAAGKHNFVWDGTDRENKTVAGGIYFYRLRYDDTSLTKKMLLLK